MTTHYAGVGSRETPKHIRTIMEETALVLGEQGLILCSGHAKGADHAFERGAKDYTAHIYLPWKGYNGANRLVVKEHYFHRVTPEAILSVKDYHPEYNKLSMGAKKLHGRNSQIILGTNLLHPVSFMVCWTLRGKGMGGTGQAIRICEAHRIPYFDLGNEYSYVFFMRRLYAEELPGMKNFLC